MARYGYDFGMRARGYDSGFRGYGRDFRRNAYPGDEALQRGRYGRDAYGGNGDSWGMYSGLGGDYDATYTGRYQNSGGGGRFRGQYAFDAQEQRGGGAAGGMVFGRYGGMDGSEFRPGYSSPRNDEVGRGVPWRGQPAPRPGGGMNRGRGYDRR